MIDKCRILKIAYEMSINGLHPDFIKNLINISFEFDTCYDLMELWYYEKDEIEKINLIEDMRDMIKDISDR